MLNLFEEQDKVYKSITKLSFVASKNLTIQIGIQGEENYTAIVNHLLKHPSQTLSINSKKFQLQQLKFNFEMFNPATMEYKPFDKFVLHFYSPTFVRNINITYLLPNPDQFLYSVWTKLQELYAFAIDEETFKKRLKNTIYVGEFDLGSKLVQIKGGKKAGVVGFCTYYVRDTAHKEFVRLLYLILHAIKFLGVGSSTKLGCGNVGCFITKK
ncbi:MAG: CRISPR system precrRNA processing endoribonuclease RAMP protein Cas6 [Candidatus Peribacteria bacterium]|nr:CRISPR system precrRNA processing endoribonuclease RAMP protein Cas6 [Candidatus Peribacteria bacterium]